MNGTARWLQNSNCNVFKSKINFRLWFELWEFISIVLKVNYNSWPIGQEVIFKMFLQIWYLTYTVMTFSPTSLKWQLLALLCVYWHIWDEILHILLLQKDYGQIMRLLYWKLWKRVVKWTSSLISLKNVSLF